MNRAVLEKNFGRLPKPEALRMALISRGFEAWIAGSYGKSVVEGLAHSSVTGYHVLGLAVLAEVEFMRSQDVSQRGDIAAMVLAIHTNERMLTFMSVVTTDDEALQIFEHMAELTTGKFARRLRALEDPWQVEEASLDFCGQSSRNVGCDEDLYREIQRDFGPPG